MSNGTFEFDGGGLTTSAALDGMLGAAMGSMVVRTGAGWVALAPGLAGQALLGTGPNAVPAWASSVPAATPGAILAATGTAGVAQVLTLGANLTLTNAATLSAAAPPQRRGERDAPRPQRRRQFGGS